MMINTERACCINCNIPLDKTSQVVVDETPEEGIVVLCVGLCPTCHEWHEWYEQYAYKGHMGVQQSERICARG